MWDKRVVRGNTYAQHTLPAVSIESANSYNNSYYQDSLELVGTISIYRLVIAVNLCS